VYVFFILGLYVRNGGTLMRIRQLPMPQGRNQLSSLRGEGKQRGYGPSSKSAFLTLCTRDMKSPTTSRTHKAAFQSTSSSSQREGTGLTGDDTAVLSTLLPPAHPDGTIPLPSSLRVARSVPSFHRLDLPSDLRLPSHTSRNFTSPIALTSVLTHILTTTPTQFT